MFIHIIDASVVEDNNTISSSNYVIYNIATGVGNTHSQ